MQDHAPKDTPKINTVERDGFKVLWQRHDPFGFIYLSLPKGELPEKYQGAYTTVDMAEQAAIHYIEEAKTVLAQQKANKKAA